MVCGALCNPLWARLPLRLMLGMTWTSMPSRSARVLDRKRLVRGGIVSADFWRIRVGTAPCTESPAVFAVVCVVSS